MVEVVSMVPGSQQVLSRWKIKPENAGGLELIISLPKKKWLEVTLG